MNLDTSSSSVRVNLSKGFFDVRYIENYSNYGVEIYNLDYFNYWAVVQWEKRNQTDKRQVVILPSKKWFYEWYNALEEKPTILFQSGKLEDK